MPESVLEVSGLAFAYDGALAVRDVSLTVQPGEIVALLGANGAGKSTTVRMIAGVLRPQKGAIQFASEALAGSPSHVVVRRGITLVPEGRLVFPQMTVMENLQLGAHISGARRSPRWSTTPSACFRACSSGADSWPGR